MAVERMLKLPGRIYEQFVVLASERLDMDDAPEVDLDLAEALGRARLQPRGQGFTVYVPLSLPQVRLLAEWIGDDQPKKLREYRKAMIEQAQALERDPSGPGQSD